MRLRRYERAVGGRCSPIPSKTAKDHSFSLLTAIRNLQIAACPASNLLTGRFQKNLLEPQAGTAPSLNALDSVLACFSLGVT